jgi:hypothetical protein
MATKLGDVEISSIEGARIRGWFRSVYTENVHQATPDWGAAMLWDAFSSLSGQSRDERELLRHIVAVHFDSPNTPSTTFTLDVDDPAVLAGLSDGAWESYYIG